MEYSDYCITAMRIYYEKGGYHGRQAYIINIEGCIFQMIDLTYNNSKKYRKQWKSKQGKLG